MKKYKFITLLVALVLILIGCVDKSDLTAPGNPNTGSADFTRFVSIGNSLTQGEQSGSVFASGQEYSYTNLIAKQVGTNFVQPTFADPGSGGRVEAASLSPFTTAVNTSSGAFINATYDGIFNNLGVKGAFLPDVMNARDANSSYTAQFGAPNPMFDAVLRGLGTQLELALAQQPTFVTLWIGNNDILAYATRGGLFPVTSTTDFQTHYGQILDALANSGANIVVANIPDVTAIPFFNTVGPQLIAQGISVVWGTNSAGAAVPMDITKNLLTLLASEELATGKGLSQNNPLSNGVILDESEIAIAKQVVGGYNQIIAALAGAKNIAVVDINSFFNNIAANGIVQDGVQFTAAFVQGGIFSLDGVHPTSRGYGIVANEFIKVINTKFNASIPLVNVSTLPGSLQLSDAGLGKSPIFPKEAYANILF